MAPKIYATSRYLYKYFSYWLFVRAHAVLYLPILETFHSLD